MKRLTKKVLELKSYIDSIPEQYKESFIESMADMLDNNEAYESDNHQLAQLIVEDGKDLGYIIESHKKYHKHYNLPLELIP